VNSRLPHVTGAAAAFLASALTVPFLAFPASAVVRPEVRYSDRNVVVGASVTARVPKSSRPDGTRLVLERQYLDGWRPADRSAEQRDKGYVLDVPTDQFGTFTYRVVALRDNGSIASKSEQDTVTVRPPYKPLGKPSQHVFSASPRVRWDSCQKIRWAFYSKTSPKHALRQVREGIERVHEATGLDFHYVGKTDQKPNPYGKGITGTDVVIGWRSAKDFRPFRKHPGTVGLGGNRYYSGFEEADGSRVSKAVRGGVVLNASLRSQVRSGYGKGYTWGEVIIHELGHVVGLAHAKASSQIMYYSVTTRNADWGAGDLAGLRMVGDTRGCLKKVSARTAPRSERFRLP